MWLLEFGCTSYLSKGFVIDMFANTVFISLLLVGLLGCASSSGKSQFDDTAYIEKIGPGEIRYLNDGASFTRKARQEDVYKKIADTCNGDFKILKEGVKTRTGTVLTQEKLENYPSARYVYVKYRCVM